MNIAVVGSLGFDFIMNFPGTFSDRIIEDKLHSISLSFLVDTLSKQHGGTAGNIAYSLKLLGIEPYILACAGNDFAPYKIFFESQKIRTKYIKEIPNDSTSSYFVVTDRQHNQIGSFYIGAMKHAAKLKLKSIKEQIDFVVIAPTEPKAMMNAVKECHLHEYPYLFDPAFQIATFSKEELLLGIDNCAILIGNEYEIQLIESTLSLSHDELINSVPILITTLGSKGAIIETAREAIHIKPAKAKAVVDPTGAGDAFRAGFLSGYLRGLPLPICGQMGAVASVYTVELFGTQTHSFTKQQFLRRYEENYGETLTI